MAKIDKKIDKLPFLKIKMTREKPSIYAGFRAQLTL